MKQEHTAMVIPLQSLAAEAVDLERRVSDHVNAAYSLATDEIQLLTAAQIAQPLLP